MIFEQEWKSFLQPLFPSRRVYAKFHPQPKTSTFCSSYQRAAKPATGILFNITTPRLITAPATGGLPHFLPFMKWALLWQAGPRSPVLTARDSCQVSVSLLTWHKYPLSLTLVNYPGEEKKKCGSGKITWYLKQRYLRRSVCEYGAGSESNDNCKLNMSARPDLWGLWGCVCGERLVLSMFYNTTKCIMEEGVKIKGICNGTASVDFFLLPFHLKSCAFLGE